MTCDLYFHCACYRLPVVWGFQPEVSFMRWEQPFYVTSSARIAIERSPDKHNRIVRVTVDLGAQRLHILAGNEESHTVSFEFLRPGAYMERTLDWSNVYINSMGAELYIPFQEEDEAGLVYAAPWLLERARTRSTTRQPKHIDPACPHCGHNLVPSACVLGDNSNGDSEDFCCAHVGCKAYGNGLFLDMNEDQLIANHLLDAPPVRTFCAKVYNLADYPSLWDTVHADVVIPLFDLRLAKDYAGINERLAALDVSKLSWAMIQAILGSTHMNAEEQLLVPEHARFWERVKAHYGNDTKLWSWLEDSVRSLL